MAKHSVNVVVKARDEASRKFSRIGKSAGGMGKMVRRAAMAAGAYLGLREIKNFASGSIKLYAAQETAVMHLSDALGNLGVDTKAVMGDMKQFAREIQNLTTQGDEVTLELMSMGASMGKLSGDSLKAATVAAMGLAKAYKMDTVAAMRLVARASAGDTASLTRYGIKLDKSLSAQEKFNAVLKIGADNFKLATGETETMAGKMAQLTNSWGDLKEGIGQTLAGSKRVGKALVGARVAIENWGLTWDIVVTNAALKIVKFGSDFRHLLIDVLPVVVKWFADNFWAIMRDTFVGLGTMIKNLAVNIKNLFKSTWEFIKNPTEGFNFDWTPMLDGFKATAAKLPEIAKRVSGPLEQALTEELRGKKKELKDLMTDAMTPKELDMDKLLANAKAGMAGDEKKKKDKKTGSKEPGKWNAVEARFLTGSTGSDPAKSTEKNTAQTASELKKLNIYLKRQTKANARKARGIANTMLAVTAFR